MPNPSQNPIDVLYEDNHLLVLNKPAGLATMGTPAGKPTLLEEAKLYIKHRYNKPGNVYLGVMSRLDAPVTGVVLIARTSKAARRMTEQFRSHSVEKIYWALVEGSVEPACGNCVDWVRKDERHRRMHVVGATLPGAKEARLSYRRLKVVGSASLLEVELQTGRKHQIRLQLSSLGHPIIGDRKYGGVRRWPLGIALHARRLLITHPVKNEPLELIAPLPDAWDELELG
jgi:23S rRNA pseudouridine1911/1915/1917 synthase